MLSQRLMLYIDEVARCGSMRKAATHLNVASSAINRQILALEDELGTPLFKRLPHRLQLTAAGEVLLDHVRQMRKGFERTRMVIDEMKGLRRGEVTIAVMSGPSGSILPLVLDRFHRDFPRTRANVRVLSGDEIAIAVEEGEADIGLAFDLPRKTGIRLALSYPYALGAVMRPGHPLARSKSLQFSDCQPYPMVIADVGMAIRPHIEALAQRHGLCLDAVIETNSIEVMRRMTMAGDLITVLTPIDILPECQAGQLAYVPFDAGTTLVQHLMLITRDRGVNPFAGLLIERLRTLLDGSG